MQRVMIIGQPGSGKSTLARRLGERTYLPVIHMDHIHWQAGWVERRQSDKTRLVREAVARPAWIFEGGHSATWADRLVRADTLIWLDLPVGIRLARVLWRTLRNLGQTRPDLPQGCPEHFNRAFLAWIWRTRISARRRMQSFFDSAPPHVAAIRLTSGAAANRFLRNLDTALAVGNLGIPHR